VTPPSEPVHSHSIEQSFQTMRRLAFLFLCPFLVSAASAQRSSLVDETGRAAFDHYHNWQETHAILEDWAARYPGLTELYSIGKSYEGVDLMVMEVTNQATGAASEKPAIYLDGGIHAAELTGSEVALYVLEYLLQGYGTDSEVTRLLDTRAFYIRPKFNPDGSNLVLTTDQSLRSTVRPVDSDFDGRLDEDPGEDLDGDGWITMMRRPAEDGSYCASPADPRIMWRRDRLPEGVEPGDLEGANCYDRFPEGIDNDSDGRWSEDGTGGIDMNRNFPRNWERWHLQPGAGDFPLSEPETYATVRFLNEHRNVAFIVHGHTSGGFVFRLPSASAPSLFDATDLDLILDLGAFYTENTGRRVIPSATHPTEHRYGTLISFGYWDHGIVGWVPEYSPGPSEWVPDADENGRIDESDYHAYNDSEFSGRYFSDWTIFDHPQLGEVEIGGWHTKYWGQNPPPELLRKELEVQVPWMLHLAARTPLMAIGEPSITSLGNDRYRIRVSVRNEGGLATHLTERGFAGRETGAGRVIQQVVRAPVVTIEMEGATVVEGGDGVVPSSRLTIPHLAGADGITTAVSAREYTAEWVVQSGGRFVIRAQVQADKGGVARSEWVRYR
jgi:zinc carboxypeptidase